MIIAQRSKNSNSLNLKIWQNGTFIIIYGDCMIGVTCKPQRRDGVYLRCGGRYERWGDKWRKCQNDANKNTIFVPGFVFSCQLEN